MDDSMFDYTGFAGLLKVVEKDENTVLPCIEHTPDFPQPSKNTVAVLRVSKSGELVMESVRPFAEAAKAAHKSATAKVMPSMVVPANAGCSTSGSGKTKKR